MRTTTRTTTATGCSSSWLFFFLAAGLLLISDINKNTCCCSAHASFQASSSGGSNNRLLLTSSRTATSSYDRRRHASFESPLKSVLSSQWATTRRTGSCSHYDIRRGYSSSSLFVSSTCKKTTSSLSMSKNDDNDTSKSNKSMFKLSQDGSGRGSIILAIVFLLCVWLFTIPPEFRRAFICPDIPACIENRERCNNCVTNEEWITGIKEYYANGGGIQWDFSIDPKTLEKNRDFIQSIAGSDK